jgi:hypothetical protein
MIPKSRDHEHAVRLPTAEEAAAALG